MVRWYCGTVVRWYCGTVVLWYGGRVAFSGLAKALALCFGDEHFWVSLFLVHLQSGPEKH